MRTATSAFVTVFDVCVVVGACLCGAITGIIGKRFIQKINSNLRKVKFYLQILLSNVWIKILIILLSNRFFQADDELALFNDPGKDKKRNLIMVVVVFISMTGMIILDVVSRWRNSNKFRQDLIRSNKRKFF